MTTLSKKIDFAVIVTVQGANPNGDPLTNNRPRTIFDGRGEISDVAIKRKIRNRLMNMDESIFVQSDDNRAKGDDKRSLEDRAKLLKTDPKKDDEGYAKEACKTWLDVRAFGQVFAFQKGVSIGVRGPVSVHSAFSIAKIENKITSTQITKSVSGKTTKDGKRGSDTMGMKYRVEHGFYVFYGSMNPQLADKTKFSDEDALAIQKAIRSLFVNDESSARPGGSMEVFRVYWFTHSNPNGKYSSATVHNAVRSKVGLKAGVTEPKDIGDYDYPSKEDLEKELPNVDCKVFELPDLNCEEIDGV